ncbi:RND transporter [Gammaproteobacteria bacterium 45_16_T64]|nr:RND transporter [Gammaproteobacteria bacterium 45_16_T64]
MSERIAELTIRWRWAILLASIFVVIACGYGAKNIHFSSNYRVFFAEGNEQLEAFNRLQTIYNKSDNVIIVMSPKGEGNTIGKGDVFTPSFLSAVRTVTEEAWQLPWSTRVDSISNYQHTQGVDDELLIDDLVEEDVTLDAAEIQRIRDITNADPLIRGRLIATTGKVTLVNITIQTPEVSENETPIVVKASRDMVDTLRQQYPDIDFRLTGMVFLDNAFSEMAQKDMSTLVPAMFVILIVTLGLLLRSFSATFATVIVIMLSIVTAMGLFGWLGWLLTPPSSAAPTIIMTMAIADCVHVLVSMLYGMRTGLSKEDAIKESIRINFMPVFITSVTTALGFLSMNFSEVPPFRDLGNTVAMGVIAAFLLAVLFLPALMSVLPVRVKAIDPTTAKKNTFMQSLAENVIANRRIYLWSTTLLTVVMLGAATKNEINDEFVKYFSTNTDFRQHTDFLSENMTGIYGMEYSLETGTEQGISNPEFLQDVEKFTEWLRTQPEVLHVFSVTDIFKRLNKNMNNDDPAYYRLPDSQELASQYLLLYELSLPYGLDLNNQITLNKGATKVSITIENMSSAKSIALEHKVNQWIDNNTHFVSYSVASPNLMFSHIGERNVSTMIVGTLLALFFISLILIAALRSLKLGLVSLAPNLIPAGIAFGVWGVFYGNLGIALGSAVGMTLGIVVDDTVHFLSKYQRARRELGKNAEDAVRYAFSTVGVALAVTTFVLIAGFMVLATSDFHMNTHMGLFTALTIAIALIVDFFFLPSLLIAIEGDKEPENTTEQTLASSAQHTF